MPRVGKIIGHAVTVAAVMAAGLVPTALGQPPSSLRFADQGPRWDEAARARFYSLDQGSRMIPLAWLRALKRGDGAPFLGDRLARYGYLSGPQRSGADDLAVGFSVAASPQGLTVGLTCAACHTREIEVHGQTWRIDGGPGLVDFQSFLAELDAAVLRVLQDDKTFREFAEAAVGPDPAPGAIERLRADVVLWSRRFHTLMSRALPADRPWGVGRLDAFGMIYNRVVGLDLGALPDYLIPDNIARADAPVRYPFLWNSSIQDRTEWPGFANNGNARLALARNLGEVYGVFAIFHPRAAGADAPQDRDYLSDNSANFDGLAELETTVQRIGPPRWPWPIDAKLAAAGKIVFDLPTDKGGCVGCHGIVAGEPRGGAATWRTPVVDVGTDTRQWRMLVRTARSGSLRGAAIPGIVAPLRETDAVANILKTAVLGAVAQADTATAAASSEMAGIIRTQGMASAKTVAPKAEPSHGAPTRGVYEARVLQGIWAAAPYLHDGSVPTLADLLKPAAERPKAFKIGRAYDIRAVGLAIGQPGLASELTTTGCDDLTSGNSNCGHELGTRLSGEQKKALLEYLKTL